MAQIFTISDGTTTIDLLSATGPYYLGRWETGINQWKDGGIFTDNPLSESSIPIFRQYDTFEEKITLHISGSTQDDVISNLRALLTILESSVEYFITGFGSQCYIEVKGDTETNSRYAVIVAYKIEELPGQFIGTPVTGGSTGGSRLLSIYSDVEIVLRRGVWLESSPGTLISAYLDSQHTYNSITFGINNSNTEPVYLPNYRTMSNVSHIYRFDTSAGTWSGNLISSSLPYNLFPSPMGVGDKLYIGVQSSLSDSAPMGNIVLNIGTATTATFDLEIWNGSTWSGTSNFSTLFSSTGAVVISPFNFAATTRNLLTEHGGSAPNVTAYWYRLTITAVGNGIVPTQATRQLYSATTPYIDVQSTNLSGDLDPITRLNLTAFVGQGHDGEDKILIGRRKYSRGSNFTGYINVASKGNPSGITVNAASWTEAADDESPIGVSISRTHALLNVTVTIGSSISADFVGKYRTFVRASHSLEAGDIYSRLTIRASQGLGSSNSSSVVYPESASGRGSGSIEVFDFGIVELPASLPIGALNANPYDIIFFLEFRRAPDVTDTATLKVYDIILIPADENIMEIGTYYTDATTRAGEHATITIDKIASPEEPTNTVATEQTNDKAINVPIYGGADAIYCARERHRFWIFSYPRAVENDILTNSGEHKDVFKASLYKLNRYLMPRGST